MLPLGGIRVLDLTRLLPGPYTSLVLAELGATVIKVEEPPLGDPLRYMPSPSAEADRLLFAAINRGKQSLTLNLKAEEGRRIFLELARRADVLLECYRPGVMQRLRLDYPAVAEVNPALVYASLSGYGQSGPLAGHAGHDLNYIAMGGLLDITGAADGAPAIPGIPAADLTSPLWTALGILAALFARGRSGRGAYLDVSMTDCVASTLIIPVIEWLCTGRAPQRGKMPLSGGQACYNVYRTADGGYMTLAALEPRFWAAFCEAMGRPDWVARQYAADQVRLSAEVAELFRTQPRAHWERLLAPHDCCCEPVLGVDEVFAHPQIVERGLLHDGCLALPIDRRGQPGAPAPELGQHTTELLTELGYSCDDIARLRQAAVV